MYSTSQKDLLCRFDSIKWIWCLEPQFKCFLIIITHLIVSLTGAQGSTKFTFLEVMWKWHKMGNSLLYVFSFNLSSLKVSKIVLPTLVAGAR